MNLQGSLNQLQVWVQEEIGAQVRMLELLGRQQRAIEKADFAALSATTPEVEKESRRGADRGQRRTVILRNLAQHWGLSPRVLTLGSLLERARGDGYEVEKLQLLRAELRRTTAEVMKEGRRIASLARYHRGLVDDIVGLVLEGLGQTHHLVDAQG